MNVTKYLKPKDETRLGLQISKWMIKKPELHFDGDILEKVDLICLPS